MERMEDEGLAAEYEKLFGYRAAHAKPAPGGRDKGNNAITHEVKLSYSFFFGSRREVLPDPQTLTAEG